jgi:hypothetical protein
MQEDDWEMATHGLRQIEDENFAEDHESDIARH